MLNQLDLRELQPKLHILYKDELKMGHRSKSNMWKCKTFRRKHKRNICVLELRKEFLGMTPKSWYAKKNDKLYLIKMKTFAPLKAMLRGWKLCCTACWKKTLNICKWHIWQRTCIQNIFFKNPFKWNNQKMNNLVKSGKRILMHNPPKRIYGWWMSLWEDAEHY